MSMKTRVPITNTCHKCKDAMPAERRVVRLNFGDSVTRRRLCPACWICACCRTVPQDIQSVTFFEDGCLACTGDCVEQWKGVHGSCAEPQCGKALPRDHLRTLSGVDNIANFCSLECLTKAINSDRQPPVTCCMPKCGRPLLPEESLEHKGVHVAHSECIENCSSVSSDAASEDSCAEDDDTNSTTTSTSPDATGSDAPASDSNSGGNPAAGPGGKALSSDEEKAARKERAAKKQEEAEQKIRDQSYIRADGLVAMSIVLTVATGLLKKHPWLKIINGEDMASMLDEADKPAAPESRKVKVLPHCCHLPEGASRTSQTGERFTLAVNRCTKNQACPLFRAPYILCRDWLLYGYCPQCAAYTSGWYLNKAEECPARLHGIPIEGDLRTSKHLGKGNKWLIADLEAARKVSKEAAMELLRGLGKDLHGFDGKAVWKRVGNEKVEEANRRDQKAADKLKGQQDAQAKRQITLQRQEQERAKEINEEIEKTNACHDLTAELLAKQQQKRKQVQQLNGAHLPLPTPPSKTAAPQKRSRDEG